jgi:transcriptional regulator with XRE-family HTH domain
MGRAKRWKPRNLHKKLKQIRVRLGLSQGEMIRALGLADRLTEKDISTFEHGLREPPLPILLRYARLVGVSTDALIDDKLYLPD